MFYLIRSGESVVLSRILDAVLGVVSVSYLSKRKRLRYELLERSSRDLHSRVILDMAPLEVCMGGEVVAAVAVTY